MRSRLFVCGVLTAAALLGSLALPARSATELLLPDLTTIDSWLVKAHKKKVQGRMQLRFGVPIYNMGAGPLEMRGHRDNTSEEMQGTQVVYDNAGGSQNFSLGTWEYHEAHHHWHVADVADYRLKNLNGDVVATTPKVSYFLEDTKKIDRTLPGAPVRHVYTWNPKFRRRSLLALTTGISVGWADVYDSSVPGQFIDITGLPHGDYILEVEVNPTRVLMESNYDNNVVDVPLHL
jgi:hypothetical protein